MVEADLIAWLLEPADPSARYLALTEVSGYATSAPPLRIQGTTADALAAQAAIPGARPARAILDAQYAGSGDVREPAGYWMKPDVGYSPKYRATTWQLLFLAQLGVPRIGPVRRACEYVLQNSRQATDGRFIAGRSPHAAIDCLNGNMLWALQWFGYGDDPRLAEARESTADAIGRRGFACRYNEDRPCGWGAIKVLRAFLDRSAERRSAAVQAAITQGTQLLLSEVLPEATQRTDSIFSKRWFELTFPLDYSSDLLEAMTVLALAGHARHARVQGGVQWLLDKQDASGRWALEHTPGKTWAGFGRKGLPNKWVTLRALRLLKIVG